MSDAAARRALVLYGATARAEARAGLVYGPYLISPARCSFVSARGGACVKLRRRYLRPRPRTNTSRRGEVLEFSRRSRTRLQQTLCAVPIEHVGRGLLFITLTYPRRWPGSWARWKRDLDRLGVKLRRKFPRAGFVWKLEPQKRGAPHFHLLVVGVPFIARGWLSSSWYDVVGSRDPKHLAAGTQVQMARSHKGVVAYASKYTAKQQQLPESWARGVGRWWGVIGRANLGIVWGWLPMTQGQYWAACRIVRGVISHRQRARGRAPPRPASNGMWAVITEPQALRIAQCALGTPGTLPGLSDREDMAHQGAGADCRRCTPQGAHTTA